MAGAKRQYNNLGGRIALAGGFQIKNGIAIDSGTGFPESGTSGTTVRDGVGAPPMSLYVDESTGVVFVNEGTAASPYWTPVSFTQRGLFGWHTDFNTGSTGALVDTTFIINTLGVPVAVTEVQPMMSNGLQLHGQGMDETDAGLTVAITDQGAVASLICTNEDAHIAVISPGTGTTPAFQPDQNGTIVVDANVAFSSLTACAGFIGFCGSSAAALDPIMTYSGTTISFAATIGDDVAGLAWSSELTDNDRWFAPHDKGNANASIATSATGVDTGVDVVASTYQRLRVECDADGEVRVFIAKVLKATFTACLDADEEIQPMFFVESSTAGTKTATMKHFSTWGKRA